MVYSLVILSQPQIEEVHNPQYEKHTICQMYHLNPMSADISAFHQTRIYPNPVNICTKSTPD